MTRATKLKAGKPVVSEKQFQEAVIQLAKLHKWRVYFTWNSIHSPAGFPDLCLIRRGKYPRGTRLAFIELKTDTGKLTEAQREWIDDLRSVPGFFIEVYVWRFSDFAVIEKILK